MQASLCFVLVLVPLVWCPLSFALEGPLGYYYVLRQNLSSRVKILAGISGHYSNENNSNLIRSQKICVVCSRLWWSQSLMWVFGDFSFEVLHKTIFRVHELFVLPVALALHLYELPFLPLVLSFLV